MKKALTVLVAAALVTLSSSQAACSRKSSAPADAGIQKPSVAGMFYPADEKTLRAQVQAMIDRAPAKQLAGRPIAIIVPHAGYQYSGRIAAAGFRQIVGRGFSRAVVIAPAHRSAIRGAALSPCDYFRTPLGDIPIDSQAVASIVKENAWARADASAFEGEHPLEVELPFLQVALKDFKLVPIIIGDASKEELDAMADALDRQFADGSTVFVISTDLSHFHTYEQAQELDSKTVDAICKQGPENFLASVSAGSCELCGARPVYVIKRIAEKRGAKIEPLAYANSGDASGDRSRVVGYAAIAAVVSESLSDRQKATLLGLARRTLEAHLAGTALPKLPSDPALKKEGAAFVTLRKNGELRGCIGHIIARGPLDRTVQEMTVAAASEDPRFSPVRPDELKDISIEISVLTPPEELPDPLAVRVGTDGLIIEKGFSRGVLLPQVPAEQGWDKTQFLQGICRKAGLPPDAYKSARLYRFQAIVFDEGKD